MQPPATPETRPHLAGQHITADLSGCSPAHPWMTQPEALRAACLSQVALAGLNAVGHLFHAFAPVSPGQPAGITGMVLLAESHLAVHTWPESGHVTLDVFVCNLLGDNRERAQGLVDALVRGFEPGAVNRQTVSRGLPQASR